MWIYDCKNKFHEQMLVIAKRKMPSAVTALRKIETANQDKFFLSEFV